MKRELLILDCPEIGCPLVLFYVFKEFSGYFQRNNFSIKVIRDLKKLHNNSIVLMGDQIRCEPVKLLKEVAPEAIYIGWYWHNIQTDGLHFIHTYENRLDDSSERMVKNKSFKYNAPFLLRADENPIFVGTYPKKIVYDYCYMGWRYCEHLVPQKFVGVYHGVKDHTKFLNYETRKNIYLSSLFALGFQADENVATKHVSQRIYEGLAYGCIVLSNSFAACEQTNHIVIHVSTRDEVERLMTYYIEHPNEAEKKRQEGYAFSKEFGTNQVSATLFLDLIDIIVQT